MASEIQDELNSIFDALMDDAPREGAVDVAAGVSDTAAATGKAETGNTVEEALGGVFSPVSLASGLGGGIAGAAANAAAGGGSGSNIAMDVLKSAFGLVPIVSGLLSLFGGGDSDAPPPLVKYTAPPTIAYEAAETGEGITAGDYGQTGMPRAYDDRAAGSAAPATGITVNVQAMDARSFLDRSSEIAAAVKDAMLNLNSINDVVNDL
jgi:hypothetical protein